MKTALLMIVAFAACVLTSTARADEEDAQVRAQARANLPKAKLTLAEAVEVAMKKVPKGKVVEAALESEDDQLRFEVEIVTGEKHQEVQIDAKTGKVIAVEDEDQDAVADEDKPQEELETEAAATAKFTLLKAIQAALKEVKGAKAFEASFEREDGKMLISVELLAGDEIKVAEYDAMSGKLVEVEDETDE